MQAFLAGPEIVDLSMIHAIPLTSSSKAVQAADTQLSMADCSKCDLVVGDMCSI